MLGTQLTASVVVVFLIWRLRNFLHFTQRLLVGIYYYQLPSDSDMLQLFRVPLNAAGNKGSSLSQLATELTVAKSDLGELKLERTRIGLPARATEGFLANRHSWDALQSTVLFSLCAFIILAASRVIMHYKEQSTDWGLIWLCIAIVYASKNLAIASMRASVQRSETQRAVMIAVGTFAFILLAYAGASAGILDFDLESCASFLFDLFCTNHPHLTAHAAMADMYADFTRVANLPISSEFRMTYSSMQLSLALVLSFCTGVFSIVFRRRATWHFEALNSPDTGLVRQFLLHAAIILPLLTTISFQVHVGSAIPVAWRSTVRCSLALASAAVQLLAYRAYLQAYFDAVPRSIKKASEVPGRMSYNNLKAMVTPSLFHINAVALQCIALPLMSLLLAAMLAAVGGDQYGIPAFANPAATHMGAVLGPVLSFSVWWLEASGFVLTAGGLLASLVDF